MSIDQPEPALLASAPPKPSLRRLFLGDDGLRAGWSLLLFLIFLAGISFVTNLLLFHFHVVPKPVKGAPPITTLAPRGTILRDGLGFFDLAVSALLMALVERRPFRRYGTPARRSVPDFLIGLLWGFAFLSGLVAMLEITHHLAWDGMALHGSLLWSYAGKWAVGFLCVGLFEEYFLRGYLQYTVARGVSGIARAMSVSNRYTYAIGFWIAAFLFSIVLFAVGHLGNGGETFSGILAVSLAGLVFVFSLWRTASLWWAIGFHAAWDWGQTFFYGTPDSGLHGVGHLFSTHPLGAASLSGGSDGPEGSLLVIPTLLLALLVIHLTLPYSPRFLTPDQMPPGRLESEGSGLAAEPSPGF